MPWDAEGPMGPQSGGTSGPATRTRCVKRKRLSRAGLLSLRKGFWKVAKRGGAGRGGVGGAARKPERRHACRAPRVPGSGAPGALTRVDGSHGHSMEDGGLNFFKTHGDQGNQEGPRFLNGWGREMVKKGLKPTAPQRRLMG